MLRLTQTLTQWLEKGGTEIGQIRIGARGREYSLCHRDDAGREDLVVFHGAEAARGISKLDDLGAYRPLKSAPSRVTGAGGNQEFFIHARKGTRDSIPV